MAWTGLGLEVQALILSSAVHCLNGFDLFGNDYQVRDTYLALSLSSDIFGEIERVFFSETKFLLVDAHLQEAYYGDAKSLGRIRGPPRQFRARIQHLEIRFTRELEDLQFSRGMLLEDYTWLRDMKRLKNVTITLTTKAGTKGSWDDPDPWANVRSWVHSRAVSSFERALCQLPKQCHIEMPGLDKRTIEIIDQLRASEAPDWEALNGMLRRHERQWIQEIQARSVRRDTQASHIR